MKKIISILLAMTLCIGSVLSLSSCFYFDILIGDSEDDAENDGQQSDGKENGKTDNEGGGTQNSDKVEFYPGLGESDILTDTVTASSRALLSTVSIVANFDVTSFGGYEITTQVGYGSGVFYRVDKSTGDAYIITNYHVVHNASSITSDEISDDIGIYLYGQEMEKYKISAEYVGGSLTQDLAVLKVSGSDVIKNSLAVPVVI